MKNFKCMPAITGLIYECTDASWKASLLKQLKVEKIFFSSNNKTFRRAEVKAFNVGSIVTSKPRFLWLWVTNARKILGS